MFLLVNTGVFLLIIATFVMAYCVVQNSMAGAQGAWFPELFTANTRASGASLAYQISAMVSGFTPFITTLLFVSFGWIGPALLFSGYAAIGLCGRTGHPRDLGAARAAVGRGGRRRRPRCPTPSKTPSQEISMTPPCRPTAARRWRRPRTASGTTSSTWARPRARVMSGRRWAPPTCWPRVYADQLRYRADDPHWDGRDRFLLSTGHYAIGLYAALAEAGIVPVAELDSYGSDGSRLPMSGMASYTPGMEISGGSLGHGLTVAVGMALGLRLPGLAARGSSTSSPTASSTRARRGKPRWAPATTGSGNLTALVDINALQADGPTAGILRIEPVADKWEACGWFVRRVDGNDVDALLAAFDDVAGQAIRVGAAVGHPVRHPGRLRRAAARNPGESPLHAHRRRRMASLPRPTHRRLQRKRTTMSTAAPLRTSAMIASFADPGQKTTPAPFGHALVASRAGRRPDRRADRGPGQVHRHAHLRPGLPAAVLPDGDGRAAAVRRRSGDGRDRVWCRSRRPIRCSPPAARMTSSASTSPSRDLNVNIVGGLARADHRIRAVAPGHRGCRDLPRHTRPDHRRPLRLRRHRQAVPQLAASPGPTYLRLLRGQVPTVLDEYDYTFELGKAKVLRGGADVVLISSGLMTMRALQAAAELATHHVDVAVVHTPTLKPFDTETVLAEVDSDRLVVTCENHTVVGGLFETVAAAAVRARARAGRSCRWHCRMSSWPQARLPTLHDRYGLSRSRLVGTVLEHVG